MNISLKKNSARILATVAATGLALTVSAGNAAAGPSGVRFSVGSMNSDGSRVIGIIVDGRYAGSAEWKANGDTLEAGDTTADGYGVGAYLGTNPVREATTFGLASPVWKSKGGDLPENHTYTFWACIGNNSIGLTWSDVVNVKS
ncbi:hypothetical protein AB0L59_08175 [Streptomyces sp. NPDC052109]|uniref:hypothetical protein n=1 Tax=Streptomyces sp. NPDC052109 TaxID=3155527 RepID=UPI00341BA203